ncbi:ATP-binding protein [Halocola ammonii]
MAIKRNTPLLRGVTSKLVITIVLAIAAIAATVFFMRSSFADVLQSVDRLADPNEKLSSLNDFYKEVSQLEREQQVRILQSPSSSVAEITSESDSLIGEVEKLKDLDWSSSEQYDRLDSIKSILSLRNDLLVDYHAIQSRFSNDSYLREHLDSLTNIVQSQAITRDTSVVTTEHKKITSSQSETEESEDEGEKEEEKKGFFQRLFGGKNDEEKAEPEPKVTEETTVTIDTLAISKRDSVLENASEIITKLELRHRTITSATRESQLQLMNTSSLLFTQLLKVLNEVEQEELDRLENETTLVADLIDSSAEHIYTILIIFGLLALVMVVLMVSDVSNANYYKKQLEAERDRANELSEIKERFLANMSHEIRTPLQSILGFSEQLLNDQPQNEKLQTVHHSSQHLLHIVNEVLDYSRISAGKYELNKSDFNLSETLEKTIDNIRIQAADKGVRVWFENNATIDSLHGDPFRLNQIVYNLAGNSVKFTDEGFVKVSIFTEDVDMNKIQLVLKIEDSGIGMTEDEVKKVFNQFEQANSGIASNFGGTGLGLNIAKTLVELHDGEINIESEKGEGTIVHATMIYELPKNNAAVPTSEPESKGKPVESVLIVDDDQSILNLSELILKKQNLDFKVTSDWEEALEWVSDHEVEMAFLDMRMPEISGSELSEKIKAVSPETTCIAFTAHVVGDQIDKIKSLGFDDILQKPFAEKELLQKLNLDQSSEMKENESKSAFVSAIQALTMGDEELEGRIAAQFLGDTRSELQKLESSIEQKDRTNLLHPIHRLSGKLGMFGAKSVSSIFRQLEVTLENNEWSEESWEKLSRAIALTESYCSEVEQFFETKVE